jgi:hypothetical protein
MTRRRINQFDPSSGTAISSYGEEVAPPQRLGWSSSCYICVLIFISFYMFVVFGVMMSKKTDLRMRACWRLSARCYAFSRAFLPLCAPLPPAVCEKAGPAFLSESAALRG